MFQLPPLSKWGKLSKWLYSSDVDECENSGICQNGGACDNSVGSYTCDCLSGFAGQHCESGRLKLFLFAQSQ